MRPMTAILLLAALAAGGGAAAATVTIEADRDATLIEDPGGLLANGIGPDLFVGRTGQAQGSRRRAVVRFDLDALPRNVVIESARLRLRVSQVSTRPSVIGVHRLLADWGEGASFVTGGGGAPAQIDDATWTHRFFDPLVPAPPAPPGSSRSLWLQPGGDFAPAASASRPVPAVGVQLWESPELAADVQQWLRKPKSNFGWILIGDESLANTARKLDSRQGLIPEFRPQLEVVYRRP